MKDTSKAGRMGNGRVRNGRMKWQESMSEVQVDEEK